MKSESEAQFSDFWRGNGAEGILVLSFEGRVMSANRAAESLLGYGVGQLTDVQFADLWSAGSRASRTLPVQARVFDGELRRQNGDALPATITISSLAGAGDNERLVTFTDRKDVERMHEALMHVQRLAGIGTLTASVAHELTNPMSIVAGACSSLLDELDEPELDRERLRRYVDLIEQSAFRCARIIEVLRNYTHGPVDGDNGPQLAVTSPQAIIDDALIMVEQQFRKRSRVEIAREVQPELTTIFCDHNRITQVLVNLLFNARDAMQPDGGTIRLRFWIPDPLHEPRLIESYRAKGAENTNGVAGSDDLFAFSVSDTGTGIAPSIESRIFEPFFTTKPVGSGTGLGLFIARSILTEHNGCIWGENGPNGGAIFTAVLPRKP